MAQSGQKSVTTAGTEVRIASSQPGEVFAIKALSGNSGLVYVGNNGDDTVSSSTGYELTAGDQILIRVKNLNQLFVDSASDGDGISWLMVE